ncbi:MAG: hypothetical protein DDT41_01455 [candidate division WS2 bacterium]|nr:hypothetical protein [Candidatus Psychracetigena formicireducens]
MAWQKAEVGHTNWIPEVPGDTLIGTVVEFNKIVTSFGEADVALIQDEEGEFHKVLVSAGLQSLLKLEGKKVKLVFLGTSYNKKTRRNFKSYEIYVDKN